MACTSASKSVMALSGSGFKVWSFIKGRATRRSRVQTAKQVVVFLCLTWDMILAGPLYTLVYSYIGRHNMFGLFEVKAYHDAFEYGPRWVESLSK